MKPRKLLERLSTSRNNVRFSDLERLVLALGFKRDRTKGSHRVFIHTLHPDAQLNLQPGKSGDAKPYQINQLLRLVEDYNLSIDE